MSMLKKNRIVKKISRKALASLFLSLIPFAIALADDEAQLPTPTPLSDYIASPTPKPTFREQAKENILLPFPHIYVKAQAAYSFTNGGSLTNNSNTPIPAFASGEDLSHNSFTGNFALGYQLHKSGLLTRLELAYMLPQDIDVNVNPAYPNFIPLGITSDFNSTIKTRSLFLKLYNDFQYKDWPVIPYIEGGVGASRISTSSNSTIAVIPGVVSFDANNDNSNTNFAWDLGVGARFQLYYPSVFLDVGYEYQNLGNTPSINLDYTQPGFQGSVGQVNLNSSKLYSNMVLAGIYWQPFAVNPNDDNDTTATTN